MKYYFIIFHFFSSFEILFYFGAIIQMKAVLRKEGNKMKISIIAIIFLSLYVGLGQLDALSLKTGLYSPVFGGAVTG